MHCLSLSSLKFIYSFSERIESIEYIEMSTLKKSEVDCDAKSVSKGGRWVGKWKK